MSDYSFICVKMIFKIGYKWFRISSTKEVVIFQRKVMSTEDERKEPWLALG